MKKTLFITAFFISIKVFAQLMVEKHFYDNGNLSSQIILLDSRGTGTKQHIISYFENGQKKEDYFVKYDSINGLNQHVVSYSVNGQKIEDYFAKNQLNYDTLKQWTEEGELHHVEIYKDSGYTAIDYLNYPKEIGEIGSYTITYTKPINVVVYDSVTFDKYEAITERFLRYCGGDWRLCYKPFILRTGIWKTYHENGVLESEGKYLPMPFRVLYPSKNDYNGAAFLIANVSFEINPNMSYCALSTYLKDGLWIYYDNNGVKTKEEFFENGLQRK